MVMPRSTSSIFAICGGLLMIFRSWQILMFLPFWMSFTIKRQASRPFNMSAPSKIARASPARQVLRNPHSTSESLGTLASVIHSCCSDRAETISSVTLFSPMSSAQFRIAWSAGNFEIQ